MVHVDEVIRLIRRRVLLAVRARLTTQDYPASSPTRTIPQLGPTVTFNFLEPEFEKDPNYNMESQKAVRVILCIKKK